MSASVLGRRSRKAHSFGVFRGTFTQAIATGAAEAHLFGHRRAALRTGLFAGTGTSEVLLRLHDYLNAGRIDWHKVYADLEFQVATISRP